MLVCQGHRWKFAALFVELNPEEDKGRAQGKVTENAQMKFSEQENAEKIRGFCKISKIQRAQTKAREETRNKSFGNVGGFDINSTGKFLKNCVEGRLSIYLLV